MAQIGAIQSLIQHWNLSSLLSKNLQLFFHWFSLAKERQPQKLLEVMTERIQLKSEECYHVSLMQNKKQKKLEWFEMIFVVLDGQPFMFTGIRSLETCDKKNLYAKLLQYEMIHAFAVFFWLRFPKLRFAWFAASTSVSSGSNNKSSSKWKFSYSYPSASTATTSEQQLGIVNFSFEEIYKSTAKFSPDNQIGEGGFGTVYKGKLSDGSLVAVKRAKKV